MFEWYETDPLTLAAKRAVDAGLVVVTAAGNLGKDANGNLQYGGITAPANAPWVITVGASNDQGTPDTSDDAVATFSSRGPTAIDVTARSRTSSRQAYHIVSLNDPNSYLSGLRPGSLVAGTRGTAFPYISLSGTSMAAPAVTGVVARMLQANPSLTPNAVKAILEYTAALRSGVDYMSQGAGFLNADGAITLASFYQTARTGDSYPTDSNWSAHILWGNFLIGGGTITPTASAWGSNIVWGSQRKTSCGARAATTSSGARARTTTSGGFSRRTSSGAATSCGGRISCGVPTSSGDPTPISPRTSSGAARAAAQTA